jgi:hypothetical protein
LELFGHSGFVVFLLCFKVFGCGDGGRNADGEKLFVEMADDKKRVREGDADGSKA